MFVLLKLSISILFNISDQNNFWYDYYYFNYWHTLGIPEFLHMSVQKESLQSILNLISFKDRHSAVDEPCLCWGQNVKGQGYTGQKHSDSLTFKSMFLRISVI